jgi:hypothetical protein
MFGKESHPSLKVAFAIGFVCLGLLAGSHAGSMTSPFRSSLPEQSVPNLVDPTTLDRKVMFGYQGWFLCPDDGSLWDGWFHWFRSWGSEPVASELTVDFWPDTSELAPDELCLTKMALPDASPAAVYSAYGLPTVVRHFRWMADYGIDGVFLQRFVAEIEYPLLREAKDKVARNAQIGAETYGRVFAVMYDVTGARNPTLVRMIINDWRHLVDHVRITESARYLLHGGRPVLGIWGLGFTHNEATPEQAMELIGYFKSAAPPKYRATLVGGVPTHWRSLVGDSQTDRDWAEVYRSFDIISPWTVGRYDDEASADSFRENLIVPDMAEAASSGVEYMPVVWPGFSWHNLFGDFPPNQIPRNGGNFFWRQVYNALASGARMLYVAMFDEVDEGTAMFKLAPTRQELPVGATLVPLDIDGYSLPSDWYLQLGGEATKMMRGEIPLSPEIPIPAGAANAATLARLLPDGSPRAGTNRAAIDVGRRDD